MPSDESALAPVVEFLRDGAETGRWLRCTFAQPSGPNANWEKLVAQPIAVAQGPAVRLLFFMRGRQTMQTVRADDWPDQLLDLLGQRPGRIDLIGREADYHARLSKGGRWMVSKGKSSVPEADQPTALPTHDRSRHHPLPPEDADVKQLFIETGLFGFTGQLRGSAAPKYRQVQHYLELLRPLAALRPPDPGESPRLRILDAGCGMAYLSLGLYLFARRLGFDVSLLGIDHNRDVIARVRRVAERLGFHGASFEAATIEDAASRADETDLLVSLHACDTATDDAIVAGVALNADAIILAPCCHHEVVHQLDQAHREARGPDAWDALATNSTLRHRLGELVTDSLRAAALEARGYRADVLEFVSAEHTLRNLMIRAERRPPGSGLAAAESAGLRSYSALRDEWGLRPSIDRLIADPGALPG